jgi:RNA polymerase sigma-70 factor (ECF subfamily)
MDSHSDSHTSASLLHRLGGHPNDTDAWGEFVHRYGGKILLWCRHWKLQEADAQDVTQDVLLRVARQMQTFRYDPGRSFRGWLKTITYRAWCDWLAAQQRPDRASGDSDILELLGGVEAREDLVERLAEEYDRELLEAASARVRLRVEPHTWEAFRLLTYEGLSGADTAARLSMKVGAVFVAKSKVHKMLRQEIAALDDEAAT